MKEPVQVRLPSRNHILVSPREQKSCDPMTLASAYDLLLHFFNSPAIESMMNGTTNHDCRLNSRLQLVYRIAHRLAEVLRFLFAYPPFERYTDISA